MDPNYPGLMECPYDKTHMIMPLRMPHHLIKCRKNHPGRDMAVCPYNALHEVPRAELKYHMMNCPQRSLLEKEITHDIRRKNSNQLKGCTDLPTAPDQTTELENEIMEEDWESERHHETFSAFPMKNYKMQPRRTVRDETVVRRPTSEGMAAKLSAAVTSQEQPVAIKPQPVFNHSIGFAHGRGIVRSCMSLYSGKPPEPSDAESKPGLLAAASTHPRIPSSLPGCALVGRGRGLIAYQKS